MAFHDTFWAVAGTTAPVIALSAIVSGREVSNLIARWGDPEGDDHHPLPRDFIESDLFETSNWLRIHSAKVTLGTYVVNLTLQTLVLAVSLVSLAYAANVVPPVLVIVLEVLGMGLLVAGHGYSLQMKSEDQMLRFIARSWALSQRTPTKSLKEPNPSAGSDDPGETAGLRPPRHGLLQDSRVFWNGGCRHPSHISRRIKAR